MEVELLSTVDSLVDVFAFLGFDEEDDDVLLDTSDELLFLDEEVEVEVELLSTVDSLVDVFVFLGFDEEDDDVL